ncbi:hypothetical protein [Methanosarcina barkeri]|nr:hypothetical protein [Methanosarcina barkeri]
MCYFPAYAGWISIIPFRFVLSENFYSYFLPYSKLDSKIGESTKISDKA